MLKKQQQSKKQNTQPTRHHVQHRHEPGHVRGTETPKRQEKEQSESADHHQDFF